MKIMAPGTKPVLLTFSVNPELPGETGVGTSVLPFYVEFGAFGAWNHSLLLWLLRVHLF